MKKNTIRLIKNKKKTKTIKRGGGLGGLDGSDGSNDLDLKYKSEREGIVDIIENKISNAASYAATTISDAGLKFIGLQKINNEKKPDDNKTSNENDTDNNKTSNENDTDNNSNPGIISNVINTADKIGSIVIKNVNEVLDSETNHHTIRQAAENTSNIIKGFADTFNNALEEPGVKYSINKAIENTGEISSAIIEAGKDPFNEAVVAASEVVPKIASASLAGVIKIGTDAVAAVPVVGAVMEVGKVLNDASKAVSASVEAGSEAIEAASDAFISTKKKFNKILNELEEKKNMAQQINNQTTKSINEFANNSIFKKDGAKIMNNPIFKKDMNNPIFKKGGSHNITKRKFFKNKAKSKRVRFAI